MARRRSPIKLQCEHWLPPAEWKAKKLGPPSENLRCRWTCVGKVGAVKFVRRKDPAEYVIVHPATKAPGEWQVTWFDKDGPWSDTRRKTCTEAMQLLDRRQWKLKEWG